MIESVKNYNHLPTPVTVIKRDGREQLWDGSKIENAIHLAASRVKNVNLPEELPRNIANDIFYNLSMQPITVDAIHTLVENKLMDLQLYDVAREYITYRHEHKPDIFNSSKTVMEYRYSHLLEYGKAVQHAYWLFSAYNYKNDVNDMLSLMSEHERQTAERAMLAIGQVEAKVKSFWGNLHNVVEAEEIWDVGSIFSESEQRHKDLYVHLLKLCNLLDEFKHIHEIPVLAKRNEYLSKMTLSPGDKKDVLKNIIMFSIFVENISLFSQFLVLMSFNEHKGMLKGMINGIAASTKEEDLHAKFGFELIKIMRKENPRLWTEELKRDILQFAHENLQVELELIHWIFDGKDLSFLSLEDAKKYIQKRFWDSLNTLDISDYVYNEDTSNTDWFDEEIQLSTNTDFFHKHSINYTKRAQSFTEDDLF